MEKITVSVDVAVPVLVAWELFTDPAHLTKWSFASSDWHSPRAENDLRTGGRFLTRMEAVDGSEGFDFEGEYTEVVRGQHFTYVMSDGRTVTVSMSEVSGSTRIIEIFDPETENSIEMQQHGWQTILHNFKKYAEEAYVRMAEADGSLMFMATDAGKKDATENTDTLSGEQGADGGSGGGD